MTLHLAVSSQSGCAMLSDSQVSTLQGSEWHGQEKQFCGPDFLLGGAGLMPIITALFNYLSNMNPAPTAQTVESLIYSFMNDEVRSLDNAVVEFLMATPHASARCIQVYQPKVFKKFSQRFQFGTIGSGAEFVMRARKRDHMTGTHLVDARLQNVSIPDMTVMLQEYADAANESLTVNDRFLIGYIIGNKTYFIGDGSITPTSADVRIQRLWPEVARQYRHIFETVKGIRGEISQAHREFQAVLGGAGIYDYQYGVPNPYDPYAVPDIYPTPNWLSNQLSEHITSIQARKTELGGNLTAYFGWYDNVLQR